MSASLHKKSTGRSPTNILTSLLALSRQSYTFPQQRQLATLRSISGAASRAGAAPFLLSALWMMVMLPAGLLLAVPCRAESFLFLGRRDTA